MAAMATRVKRPADMRPIESPKLSRPTARPPRMTVKLSHERNVRSLAKKTLGSTRVGRAMRLPGRKFVSEDSYSSCVVVVSIRWLGRTRLVAHAKIHGNSLPGAVCRSG